MGYHLVRYSLMGQVGRFVSADSTCYPHRSRVIVRSARGLEIGEVLAELESAGDTSRSEGEILRPEGEILRPEGEILRQMTVEDQLLEARLEKNRHQAFHACCALLDEHHILATLVDVEHLFDGEGLFFYFLGDVPSEVEQLTQQIADTYEATVEFRQFSETLCEGCGSGCGMGEAKGQGQGGCDSCTSCVLAAACSIRK